VDKNKRDHYRKLLERKLEESSETLSSMKRNHEAEQNKFSPSELSNYDNHPADTASELYLTEMNSALKVHEQSILSDIREAMQRIDDGTYGICKSCGEEISEERLNVKPEARFCIRCEQEAEEKSEKKPFVRAIEEEVMGAPFGRKYLNKQEDDEHEGMDQLNDLMKYGSSDGPQDMGGYHDYEEFYTNKVDDQGIVDDMDRIPNQFYKKQVQD